MRAGEVQAQKRGAPERDRKISRACPTFRREYLYPRFLHSIGLDPVEAGRRTWLPWTRNYIDGRAPLYSDRNYPKALGASFGIAPMAIPM
jgi:hypothetical protein